MTTQRSTAPQDGYAVHTWSGHIQWLPLSEEQFQSLMSYVDEMTALRGCDNTLAHAQMWARANHIGWGQLARSLRSLGSYCDCELLMNVITAARVDDP